MTLAEDANFDPLPRPLILKKPLQNNDIFLRHTR